MCENIICIENVEIDSNIQIELETLIIQNSDCADCVYFEFEGNGKGWCQQHRKHVTSSGACSCYDDGD